MKDSSKWTIAGLLVSAIFGGFCSYKADEAFRKETKEEMKEELKADIPKAEEEKVETA